MKYVDTDVFVYWATDHPDHGRRATEILRRVELNEKAVSSVHSLWMFHKVMRSTQGYSLPQFLEQVTRLRNLKFLPLGTETLRKGAEAAKRFSVSEEVGIAYVTAESKGADGVYSTNPEFDRTDLKRVF